MFVCFESFLLFSGDMNSVERSEHTLQCQQLSRNKCWNIFHLYSMYINMHSIRRQSNTLVNVQCSTILKLNGCNISAQSPKAITNKPEQSIPKRINKLLAINMKTEKKRVTDMTHKYLQNSTRLLLKGRGNKQRLDTPLKQLEYIDVYTRRC